MTATMARQSDHVPADLCFDVDFFDLPGGSEDVQLLTKTLQDQMSALFWMHRNCGHWMVTRSAG